MSFSKSAYKHFIQQAFEILLPENEALIFELKGGKYLKGERVKFTYLFEDYLSGSLAYSNNGNIILGDRSFLKGVEKTYIKEKFIEYDDIDFFLEEKSDFNEFYSSENIYKTSSQDKEDISIFLQSLNEQDLDTLDYSGDEAAYALKTEGKIVALSRYYKIPEAQGLADITIVVLEKFRGRGFSIMLASRLIKDILDNGLIPKYRANYELKASIAIAKKLGFKPFSRFIVWADKPSDSFRVAIAQLENVTNLKTNQEKVWKVLDLLSPKNIDLILFPECFLSGFSTEANIPDREFIEVFLKEIQGWCDKYKTSVVLPSAVKEDDKIYNMGFVIKENSISSFYKEGLTGSEKKFFSIPKKNSQKVFSQNNISYAILTCMEAQEDPKKYFDLTEVDFILWPGYWGWKEEDSWSKNKQDGSSNDVFLNQAKWKKPLIQCNFAINEKRDSRDIGPEGLSVIVDSKNKLIERGSYKREELMIVDFMQGDLQFHERFPIY